MRKRVSATERSHKKLLSSEERKKRIEMLRAKYPNAVAMIESIADGYNTEESLKNLTK